MQNTMCSHNIIDENITKNRCAPLGLTHTAQVKGFVCIDNTVS